MGLIRFSCTAGGGQVEVNKGNNTKYDEQEYYHEKKVYRRELMKYGSLVNRKETLAYAAGLIDGEGSVILHKSGRWRCPGISVTSTSMELLEWLKTEFGGAISSKNETRPKHSPSWQWRLSGPSTMKLLPLLLPYMVEKKKKLRTIHIIQGFELAKAQGGRDKFEQDFYSLS